MLPYQIIVINVVGIKNELNNIYFFIENFNFLSYFLKKY